MTTKEQLLALLESSKGTYFSGEEIARRLEVSRAAMEKLGVTAADIAAIGITNQRETTVIWEKASGKPIANAISLPLNHFARILLTVVPAISQPQPNIIKPNIAIFAEPGIEVHHELSHTISLAPNHSEIPTYLIAAPSTISEAESSPVNRTPILSKMIPAKIKKPKTLSRYSPAA